MNMIIRAKPNQSFNSWQSETILLAEQIQNSQVFDEFSNKINMSFNERKLTLILKISNNWSHRWVTVVELLSTTHNLYLHVRSAHIQVLRKYLRICGFSVKVNSLANDVNDGTAPKGALLLIAFSSAPSRSTTEGKRI